MQHMSTKFPKSQLFNIDEPLPNHSYTHIIILDLVFYTMTIPEIKILLQKYTKHLCSGGCIFLETIDFDFDTNPESHMSLNPLMSANYIGSSSDIILNNVKCNVDNATFSSNTKHEDSSIIISETIRSQNISYFMQHTLFKIRENKIIELFQQYNFYIVKILPLAHSHSDYNPRNIVVFQLHD